MIATRTLKLQREKDVFEIVIRIFAPEGNGRTWLCRYEIHWPEGRQIMNAGGFDSVQAILLAFQMIGADIYTSPYHKSGRLVFEAPGMGYGFPVPETLRHLLVGNDREYGA